MESAMLSAVSDDREEGEIVDDDFEDISDNSIIVPIFGKSVSSKEHLPAISLSSVTEVDEPKAEEKIRHRQKTRRKNPKTHRKKRNSHRKAATYSDSDSDVYLELDRKLQNQLKAAIRVDDIEERHKNSLRSRLRAMTKLDDHSDNCVEKNENNIEKVVQNKEHKESSDEGDTELTQLRLEALRTAVLNKYMHRKKRKMKEAQDNGVLSDISIKTDTSETNKENNHNTNENVNVRVEENPPKKLCVEKPVENLENKIELATNIVIENNTPPEDDEDVLRALLLASMSKKITNEIEPKKTIVLPPNKNSVKQTTTKMVKSDAKNVLVKNVAVKNVTVKNVAVKNIAQFKNRVVKNNVIIKQAVQLPKVKPLIINVNGDSESDDDIFNKTKKNASIVGVQLKPIDIEIESTVEKFLKEQRAKVEAQLPPIVKAPPKANNSVIHEKSSVKLLPKVKQIEYQKLLQKLKNAEKKPRIRRLSNKYTGDGKTVGITSKRFVRTKTPLIKQANVTSKTEQFPDIRSEARTLHKTLKEMQIQRNGRLQIQEKYKVLMPIVKKINEASTERKKCDEEVKRLFEELAEAKRKLFKCQHNFSAHVRELIGEKEEIDKSLRGPEPVEEPKTRFTSTPIKGKLPPLDSFETSSVPAATPNQTIRDSPIAEASPCEPHAKVGDEEEVVDAPLNPGDPNDIDKIYSKQKQKSSMPKYISPLDKVKRAAMDDPFLIVCPYDVDGNCRDPECVYKHLFN